MRINAAGKQETTLCIDNAYATGNHKIRTGSDVPAELVFNSVNSVNSVCGFTFLCLLDFAIFDINISRYNAIVVDNLSFLDIQPILGTLFMRERCVALHVDRNVQRYHILRVYK